MIEYTKVVIRSPKSKGRQYNGQKKTDNRTNNDLQNTTQKTRMKSDLAKGKEFLLH
jgi:hypothetical protein